MGEAFLATVKFFVVIGLALVWMAGVFLYLNSLENAREFGTKVSRKGCGCFFAFVFVMFWLVMWVAKC